MPVLKEKTLNWDDEEVLIRYGKRRTVQLRLKRGQIVLNAPVRISDQWLTDFLNSRREWISAAKLRESQIHLQGRKALNLSFKEGQVLFLGEWKPCVNPSHFYHTTGARQLIERAEEWKMRLPEFKVQEFKLRTMKARWGSCNRVGVVTLNRYLIALPSHLIDLVIVHEFVHRVHFDHSPAFYGKLFSILPDGLVWQRELREWAAVLPR